MIVVVPSCRQVDPATFAPLVDAGARFIIVDDSEGRISSPHPSFRVVNWGDHARLLGDNAIAIPRRNGACRDLGFFLAWKEAEPGELVIALDDDCKVEDADFAGLIERRLTDGVHRAARGAGKFFNIFDLFETPRDERLFPRGFPYSARLGYRRWSFDAEARGTVAFNVGLWRGIFDINAIDKLALECTDFPEARLAHPSAVVPPGVLASACSGSLQFRRELIPAVYQLPMAVEVLSGARIDRYGDIWAGYILKTLMDIRGDLMTVGGPLVHHQREGGSAANAAREHLAHLVNEEFVALLAECAAEVRAAGYLEMMRALHDGLRRRREKASPILRAYLVHLDRCLSAWLAALGSAEYAHA